MSTISANGIRSGFCVAAFLRWTATWVFFFSLSLLPFRLDSCEREAATRSSSRKITSEKSFFIFFFVSLLLATSQFEYIVFFLFSPFYIISLYLLPCAWHHDRDRSCGDCDGGDEFGPTSRPPVRAKPCARTETTFWSLLLLLPPPFLLRQKKRRFKWLLASSSRRWMRMDQC